MAAAHRDGPAAALGSLAPVVGALTSSSRGSPAGRCCSAGWQHGLHVQVQTTAAERRRLSRAPIIGLGAVEQRYELQARNEALLRTVNDRIRALDQGAAWADADARFEFVCECGTPNGCDERVQMSLGEYERVRSQRDRFAVVPGHQADDIEQVVEGNDRFLIVDKRDAVEQLVE